MIKDLLILKELNMKKTTLLLILFWLNGCTAVMDKNIKETKPTSTEKRSFQNVWNEVAKDPYTTLPQTKVSYFKLSSQGKNIILEDSKRTLQSRADIIAPFEKLAHPNGVCLKGVWEIYHDSPYSGYFKKGSKALIIARASSAMSNTRSGEIRAFGLAGKIFPTMDVDEISKQETANFFLIDDLGGTDAVHFTDVVLTNAPTVSTTSEVLKHLLYGLKVVKAFETADKHPKVRQVYEISYLGEKKSTDIITPKWMKVQARQGQTVDAEDFRDELSLVDGKKLIFDIAVASEEIEGKKVWKNIGLITFDASMASGTCDRQLHFHHPLWREDLKH